MTLPSSRLCQNAATSPYSTAHLKQKTAEESKTVPMAFILEASELLGTSSTCPSHTDLTIQGS